jgi:hypothetical protein
MPASKANSTRLFFPKRSTTSESSIDNSKIQKKLHKKLKKKSHDEHSPTSASVVAEKLPIASKKSRTTIDKKLVVDVEKQNVESSTANKQKEEKNISNSKDDHAANKQQQKKQKKQEKKEMTSKQPVVIKNEKLQSSKQTSKSAPADPSTSSSTDVNKKKRKHEEQLNNVAPTKVDLPKDSQAISSNWNSLKVGGTNSSASIALL